MKILSTLADDAVLAEIGGRLAQRRIELDLTQADLAREAGVSKRTVERIERGASAQLSSFLRVLRRLELLPALDALLPEPRTSPLELLQRERKQRERVSSRRRKSSADPEWKWGDES